MSEIRRMRPLLGTFVEVTVDDERADAHAAIDACFGVIERVQSLMSFHDAESDLSRLNHRAQYETVTVHHWTWRVLKTCQRLHEASNGLFDPAIAELLVREGRLPVPHFEGTFAQNSDATFSDVRLIEGRKVEFRRPLWLDLGGIAKGFAVDMGIAMLRANGVRHGHINAGGDLRAIGAKAVPVFLRNPEAPSEAIPIGMLSNAACATSAGYFNDDGTSNIVMPPTRRRTSIGSVTVLARSCMIADALTKVVGLMGREAAEPILKQFSATAIGEMHQ